MLQKYVSEYSVDQNTFHYEQLYEAIAHNKQMIADGLSNDFKIIGIFDTVDEAMEYNIKFREELKLAKGEISSPYHNDRGMKPIDKIYKDWLSK